MAKKKKQKNEKTEKIYLIAVVIIILAGLSIYLFNFIKGNNLYQQGKVFDFRDYLEPRDYDPFYRFKIEKLAERINGAVIADDKEQPEIKAEPGIYFTKFFLKENPIESYNYINDFWENINASQDVRVTDLYAKNCFIIEVSAENREQTLVMLKENEQVTALKINEPPQWEICYKQAYYFEQIEEMYASDDVILLKEQNEGDYIARLENDISEEELKKIEEMYSDVIKIKK